MALLLSKRLLPANPPLSIHIALSFILSLWQIIGSSKVAIPNCLYTHNSSPSIQATVHPSILPSSHPAIPSSYFLFLFLSLPSPWWWCITVTAIAISALYLVYYDKLLLKKGHIHTHAEGQNSNKLLSDLWQLLRVKKGRFCCFITISTMFLLLLFSLKLTCYSFTFSLCVSVHVQGWLSAHGPGVVPRGVCGGLYVQNWLKEKGTLVYNVSAVNLR